MTFPLNLQRLSSGNKALKGIFALLLVFATGSAALAQTDIRAEYNFAPNSQVATAVVENWSVDNWGDNYLSAGFGLKAKPVSLGGAWLEYARNFNFWHQVPVLKDFSLQAEFNGRVNMDNFNALFGLSYTLPLKGDDVLRFSVLYKTFSGNARSSVPAQLTVLWRLYDLFSIQGLVFRGTLKGWGENINYWWGDPNPLEGGKQYFCIEAQPQLWYAVGQFFGAGKLSIGGEVALSYNWLGCRGFHVYPSAGVKLQF